MKRVVVRASWDSVQRALAVTGDQNSRLFFTFVFSYYSRFVSSRGAKILNRSKRRERRADGAIAVGCHRPSLALKISFLRSLRFLLFNWVAASGRAGFFVVNHPG